MKHKDTYKTSGFVKPGACIIDTLTASVMGDVEKLMNIVFGGGTNDISKNNSQGGLKDSTFCITNSHTNIILVSVQHQYDLSDWSYVNSEVKTFNRILVKIMKPFKDVMVVKVDLKRKFFY
jgi:hypothetical protein